MKQRIDLVTDKIAECDKVIEETNKEIISAIIEDVQTLVKDYPEIDSFIMAMGTIFFSVNIPYAKMHTNEDNEENEDNETYSRQQLDVLDIHLANMWNTDRALYKTIGMWDDERFQNLIKFINKWNDQFKLYGEGVRLDRKNNFEPCYDW